MPKVIDETGLFEAAVSVFAEFGYQAATTAEIARRAGVNEVTIFRRYGNKAGLITAALGHALARSPFAEVSASDDVEADLVALLTAYQQTFQQYGGAVLTLLVEVPRHPELAATMQALLPNLANAAGVIAAHQEGGELSAGDPWQMLVLLIGPLMAAGLWARTGAAPAGAASAAAASAAAGLDPRAVAAAFLHGHARPPR